MNSPEFEKHQTLVLKKIYLEIVKLKQKWPKSILNIYPIFDTFII